VPDPDHAATRQRSWWTDITSSPTLRDWRRTARLLKTIAANVYQELAYVRLGTRRTDLWKEDSYFVRLYEHAQPVTLLNPLKLHCLYQFAREALRRPGQVGEFGVYRGGSAYVLSKLCAAAAPDRTLHLFDTFEGLPDQDPSRDLHRRGDFQDTSLQAVQAFLVGCDNVTYHPGLFSQTLPQVTDLSFCFTHIDADLYPSILECCEFIYPRTSPGGVMLIDDYGFLSCPGAKQAVDEFFADKPDRPIALPTGQCVVIKG
jgi:O-methyltransferase